MDLSISFSLFLKYSIHVQQVTSLNFHIFLVRSGKNFCGMMYVYMFTFDTNELKLVILDIVHQ